MQNMRKKFNSQCSTINLTNFNKSKALFLRQKSINKSKYIDKLFLDTDPKTCSRSLWKRVGNCLNKKN